MTTNRRRLRQAAVEQEGVDDVRTVDTEGMRVVSVGLLLYTPNDSKGPHRRRIEMSWQEKR